MFRRVLEITIFVLCCLLCTAVLSACAEREAEPLDTGTLVISGNRAFEFSLSEFIDRYNCLYEAENDEAYILPKNQWECFEYSGSPFCSGEYQYYRFNADISVLTHPTLTAYVPLNGENVYAVTVDFDDHGYSPELYRIYEEQCFYALKAVLSDCSDEDIIMMYTQLNRQANENMFLERLDAETVPLTIWYSENVGVFSYFSQGDYMHICIVPVTYEYLNEMQEHGAELRKLEEIQ